MNNCQKHCGTKSWDLTTFYNAYVLFGSFLININGNKSIQIVCVAVTSAALICLHLHYSAATKQHVGVNTPELSLHMNEAQPTPGKISMNKHKAF